MHYSRMDREQFKQTRKAMGYSANMLARRWGLTAGAIYHWESGKVPLPQTAVEALAYLSTIPRPDPPPRLRPAERYQEGTRVGRLVVLAVHAGGSSVNLQVTVECDCGETQTVRVKQLTALRQCGPDCAMAHLPLPANEYPVETLKHHFRFPDVVPPAPREGPSHRAKFKRLDRMQQAQQEARALLHVRPTKPPVADDYVVDEERQAELNEAANLLDDTPEAARALYIKELKAAAKAEEEASNRAIEASWEAGLEEDDDDEDLNALADAM